jgi:arginine:pyruvate transaminase
VRVSKLTSRISGPSARAWDLHYRAVEAHRQGRDVIVLSVGDPSFDTASAVTRRAIDALLSGDTHYTEIAGRAHLRAAVAADHARRTGQPVGPEHVAILSGAQNALFSAALCLFEAGDEVIVPEPMYLTYPAVVESTGARMATIATAAQDGFRINPRSVVQAVTSRTKAIMFATPNNPTGVICSAVELDCLAQLARERDLWVIADEVYRRFCFDAAPVSIAALPGMAERTITIGSLSKSHAMSGWRVGWVVAPEHVIAHVENLALCMLYGLPGFIQEAATEALTKGDADVERMRTTYQRRRDEALGMLATVPGLHCVRPQAGMFMLVDVRGTGLAADEFAARLYADTGVAVLDAGTFGPSVTGHIRMSFAVDDWLLAEGCRRIAAFVSGLAGEPAAADRSQTLRSRKGG